MKIIKTLCIAAIALPGMTAPIAASAGPSELARYVAHRCQKYIDPNNPDDLTAFYACAEVEEVNYCRDFPGDFDICTIRPDF